MIDAICTPEGWQELLHTVDPRQRFYEPQSVNQELVQANGSPILFVVDAIRIHFYPPARTGDWANATLKQGRDH